MTCLVTVSFSSSELKYNDEKKSVSWRCVSITWSLSAVIHDDRNTGGRETNPRMSDEGSGLKYHSSNSNVSDVLETWNISKEICETFH